MPLLNIADTDRVLLPEGATGGRIEVDYDRAFAAGAVLAGAPEVGRAVLASGREARFRNSTNTGPLQVFGVNVGQAAAEGVTIKVYPEGPGMDGRPIRIRVNPVATSPGVLSLAVAATLGRPAAATPEALLDLLNLTTAAQAVVGEVESKLMDVTDALTDVNGALDNLGGVVVYGSDGQTINVRTAGTATITPSTRTYTVGSQTFTVPVWNVVQSGVARQFPTPEAFDTLATTLTAAAASASSATANAVNATAAIAKVGALGVVRTNKAALDTAFASVAVGETGFDAATEELYLKEVGAPNWGVPYVHLGAGTRSLKYYGLATSGITDSQRSDRLELALQDSVDRGVDVRNVFTTPLILGRPLIVPVGVKGSIYVAAGVGMEAAAVVTLPNNFCDMDVRVQTTNLVTFSGEHIVILGTNPAFNRGRFGHLRVDGSSAHVTANTGSKGVVFRAGNGSISFVSAARVTVNNAGVALLLQSNANNSQASDVDCYVNGVTIRETFLNGARQFIVLDAQRGEVSWNRIMNVITQSRNDGASVDSVRMQDLSNTAGYTGRTGANVIDISTGDWGYKPADANGRRIAHTLPSWGGGTNNVIVERLLYDEASAVQGDRTRNTVVMGVDTRPAIRGIVMPDSLDSRYANGDASNSLCDVDRRGLATVTTSGPAATGPLNVFRYAKTSMATWANLNADFVYTIDFGSANAQDFFDAFGLEYRHGFHAKYLKAEYKNSSDVWVTIFETTDIREPSFVWQYTGQNSRYTGVRGLRFTINAPFRTDGQVRLAKLWAHIGSLGPGAWAPTHAPQFTGQPLVRLSTNNLPVFFGPSASPTIDFASIAANATATSVQAVTGTSPGDAVLLGTPDVAGIEFTAKATGFGQVTVYAKNTTGSPIDPPSQTFNIRVVK